jgi:hypothetical protein
MPTGLSGDSSGSLGLDSVGGLQLIENRVITQLLATMMGTGVLDNVDQLRNDYAIQLGIPAPITGANS